MGIKQTQDFELKKTKISEESLKEIEIGSQWNYFNDGERTFEYTIYEPASDRILAQGVTSIDDSTEGLCNIGDSAEECKDKKTLQILKEEVLSNKEALMNKPDITTFSKLMQECYEGIKSSESGMYFAEKGDLIKEGYTNEDITYFFNECDKLRLIPTYVECSSFLDEYQESKDDFFITCYGAFETVFDTKEFHKKIRSPFSLSVLEDNKERVMNQERVALLDKSQGLERN